MDRLAFEQRMIDEFELQGIRLWKLNVTRNRVRLLSYRRTRAGIALRVSERLFGVGAPLIAIIAGYIAGEARSERALKNAIAALPAPGPPLRRRPKRVPKGAFFQLDALLNDELEASGIDGGEVGISWGYRRAISLGQRSIRLGSYRPDSDLIRIHRILDQPTVPENVLRFIIFHELLHRKHGRKDSWTPRHTPDFRCEERRHPAYEDASDWLNRELPRLLKQASTTGR